MAEVKHTENWKFPVERIYEMLIDYNAYPEFVPGVQEIEVLESHDSGARVKYSINIIKKLSYILKLNHERPHRIFWELESGDLFKKNSGFWELESLGESETQVSYGLEVDIKGFVPKTIVKGLTSKNLPAMMKAFHDRVEK